MALESPPLCAEGYFPSALRNRIPLLHVIERRCGDKLRKGDAKVLFIAEGSGAHCATLAKKFPLSRFVATDLWEPLEIEAVTARLRSEGVPESRAALARLDVLSESEEWERVVGGAGTIDLALCVNM